jgi:hypothetical protein
VGKWRPEARQKEQPCAWCPGSSARELLGDATSKPWSAKAQDDDVYVSHAGEPPDGGGPASHDGAPLDFALADLSAQLNHAQIKAAGEGAHSPLLLAR